LRYDKYGSVFSRNDREEIGYDDWRGSRYGFCGYGDEYGTSGRSLTRKFCKQDVVATIVHGTVLPATSPTSFYFTNFPPFIP